MKKISLKQPALLVGFPAFIVLSVVFTHFLAPGFWTEFLATVFATYLAFYFASRRWVTKQSSEEEIEFRGLLISFASCVIFVMLANKSNPNENYFGPVPSIILIFLLTVSIIAVKKSFRYLTQDRYGFQRGINNLASVLCIGYMLTSMWAHFGSLFIFLPALGLTLLTLIFFDTTDICRLWEGYTGKTFVGLSPLWLALVSVVYQFWFAKIVWGIVLWHILAVLLGVFVTFFIFALVKFYRDVKLLNRKEQEKAMEDERAEKQKRQREEASKVEAEKKNLRDTEERFRKEKELIEQIKKTRDALNWPLVLDLYRNSGYQPLKQFSEDIRVSLGLEELVSVSSIKMQIVWDDDLKNALKMINDLARAEYKDKVLEVWMKKIQDLESYAEKHNDYDGHKSLHKEIRECCPKVVELLEFSKNS